jgi:hypothetical protein
MRAESTLPRELDLSAAWETGACLNGLFPATKYASGVAKQCFETVVHVLLDVAVKQR